MHRKAEALAAQMPLFSRGRSKVTGQPFIIVPASTPSVAHWTATDGSGCTCIGFQRRGTCTHAIAAQIVNQPAAQPARRTYAELYPVCSVNGCDEDAGRSGRCMDHNRRLLAND